MHTITLIDSQRKAIGLAYKMPTRRATRREYQLYRLCICDAVTQRPTLIVATRALLRQMIVGKTVTVSRGAHYDANATPADMDTRISDFAYFWAVTHTEFHRDRPLARTGT